jgi:hypothetical protein
MNQLAPLLNVDTIEPCLAFWTERLGFQLAAQAPGDDGIAFAMLIRDNVHVMYQTHKSLAGDLVQLADEDVHGRSMLYLSVSDIDEVEKALDGVEVLVPRRVTFYGATEIGYREPGGNVVIFAQHGD